MWRPVPLIAALSACLFTTLGCSGAYRTRILLPLAGSPDRIERELCDRECRIGHNEQDYEYLRCLVTCPGVVVTHDEGCAEEDLPPRAICRVTDMDPTASRAAVARSEGNSGGSILGALVGAMAVGALQAATGSRSGGSSSEGETAATSNATGKGSVPLPSRPASSSKTSKSDSHQKAEPKRGK